MEFCRIEGCGRKLKYKKEQLCQTHYHRLWRTGTTDERQHKVRLGYVDDRGYVFKYAPTHPLVSKGFGYVAEHRLVLYEAIGDSEMHCELCGKSLTWKTCCVDHIDEVKGNNALENLRPTCMQCNARRNLKPAYLRVKNARVLEYNGEKKTISEWARDPRVNVSTLGISDRKRRGFSDEDALFAEKKTHKSGAKT